MRASPRGDRTSADIERLAHRVGLLLRRPTGSSHYVVVSVRLERHLTVPFKRPIKAVHVTAFIKLIDAHLASGAGGQDG